MKGINKNFRGVSSPNARMQAILDMKADKEINNKVNYLGNQKSILALPKDSILLGFNL